MRVQSIRTHIHAPAPIHVNLSKCLLPLLVCVGWADLVKDSAQLIAFQVAVAGLIDGIPRLPELVSGARRKKVICIRFLARACMIVLLCYHCSVLLLLMILLLLKLKH